MQDVIRFPLPTKPLKNKQKGATLTPSHIIFVIESVLEKGLPLQHVPVILSYTYTGILTLREKENAIVLRIVDGALDCSYSIKKSSFQV